jgi:hypothetical protein
MEQSEPITLHLTSYAASAWASAMRCEARKLPSFLFSMEIGDRGIMDHWAAAVTGTQLLYARGIALIEP